MASQIYVDPIESQYYYVNVGFNRFHIDRRYINLAPLGDGAYGFVASAFDTNTNRPVAIKKVKDTCINLLDGKRILRELKLLRHFNSHENIVSIYDIMTDPPNCMDFRDIYIVTNLFESDLERIITSKQDLTDQHFQFFIYQILRALKYVHSANVLHRDLKPSNLLVNSNCDLAVCDFGLARGFSADSPEPLTEYVVTRWYRAPELLCDNKYYGKAVDMWSVGCIFAEMINQRPFFAGDNPQNQLKEIISKLGCPPKEKLDFIQSKAAYNFVVRFEGRVGPHFSVLFPRNTSFLALDLLRKMLTFHPDDRISVEDALEHPYFKSFHSQMQEPSCPDLFNFDLELTVLAQYGWNHKIGSTHRNHNVADVTTLRDHNNMNQHNSNNRKKFNENDGNHGVGSFLSNLAETFIGGNKRQRRSNSNNQEQPFDTNTGAQSLRPFTSIFKGSTNHANLPNQSSSSSQRTSNNQLSDLNKSYHTGSSTELAPLTKDEVQQLIFNEVLKYRPFIQMTPVQPPPVPVLQLPQPGPLPNNASIPFYFSSSAVIPMPDMKMVGILPNNSVQMINPPHAEAKNNPNNPNNIYSHHGHGHGHEQKVKMETDFEECKCDPSLEPMISTKSPMSNLEDMKKEMHAISSPYISHDHNGSMTDNGSMGANMSAADMMKYGIPVVMGPSIIPLTATPYGLQPQVFNMPQMVPWGFNPMQFTPQMNISCVPNGPQDTPSSPLPTIEDAERVQLSSDELIIESNEAYRRSKPRALRSSPEEFRRVLELSSLPRTEEELFSLSDEHREELSKLAGVLLGYDDDYDVDGR